MLVFNISPGISIPVSQFGEFASNSFGVVCQILASLLMLVEQNAKLLVHWMCGIVYFLELENACMCNPTCSHKTL